MRLSDLTRIGNLADHLNDAQSRLAAVKRPSDRLNISTPGESGGSRLLVGRLSRSALEPRLSDDDMRFQEDLRGQAIAHLEAEVKRITDQLVALGVTVDVEG